uniref:LOW QUALITY PROTEIN: apoptotic chromatin condensation inducer in the nucleus-like n=1 Tax=Erigeron canadensis TaxID=72917 RepID=UPI001CB88FA0|nr:LOW QUALITY PROTEIN: apoptotic chromatin condensation inducer in the nucleus-like [Erigeron canadensis]
MTEIKNTDVGLNQENGEPKPQQQSPEELPELGSSDLISGNQVDEVSQVQSDSNSIDTITNIEKNEIKDNVIDDDVKLEIDVKPETILDRNNSESVEVDEQHEDKPAVEEKDANIVNSTDIHNEKDDVIADDVELDAKVEELQPLTESTGVDEPVKENLNTENVDICKKNDSGDVGSPEKLNLDGDDSMEEDILESKQIDSKFSSDEVGDKSEKIGVKEDGSVHGMVEDENADKSFAAGEDKMEPSVPSTKRKPYDHEGSENSEVVKRQRRWNSESLKVPEQVLPNHSASATPKDAFQTLAKRTFSRSESIVSQDSPKERIVPPTSNPPTTSLRINHFLRPFTLKAVQELLGQTGTVVSFWMDQIKTHCYVTYASVEEAIETRNAVCNLQWPAYGGRLLMADFVDPQEVKNRVDPPPPSSEPPITTIPPATTKQPPQPSPRQKQQLPPPPTLPPPPPLSNAPLARARVPPAPEKIDPPIVTLDDLFKKTRATPRIYYLPLSDEQVAAKLNAQGKPVKH